MLDGCSEHASKLCHLLPAVLPPLPHAGRRGCGHAHSGAVRGEEEEGGEAQGLHEDIPAILKGKRRCTCPCSLPLTLTHHALFVLASPQCQIQARHIQISDFNTCHFFPLFCKAVLILF